MIIPLRMKRRTATLVLVYILSAIAGGVLASLIGFVQPFVAIVANLCAVAVIIWMTTSEKGKKLLL